MNTFQQNILDQLPQFTENDFNYFISEAQQKVGALQLDKTCKINTMFIDSIDPSYSRCQYCLLNCGFKCIDITPGSHKTID